MEQTKFRSKADKQEARETVMEAERDEKIRFFQFPETGLTVAVKRTSPKMIAFAVSIASPSETKFRKLIGKRMALRRFDMGAMPAVCPASFVEEFAAKLAYLVG